MNRTVNPIPAQCRRCGALFDISYDFEDMDEDRLVLELLRSVKNPKTYLCWECRQIKN